MGEKRGTKALEVWCKRVTEGYPGVKVENMTTSWRDGLAFCALIHHFRPDLIDFDSLDKRDVYRNNELAFRIAERHLGIPALLDAEDMVEYEVPDRLSMLTYLSQFYQTFIGQQGYSPNSRTPVKRSSVSPSLSSSPDLSPSMSPTSSSPPTKVSARGVSGGAPSRSHDSCTHCGLPVFLAERLMVGTKRALYHRTCFRCARCSAQLTLANCYETEDGGFCCETCPDEENDKSDTSSQGTGVEMPDSKSGSICHTEVSQELTHRSTSLSDDEKSSESQLGKVSTAVNSADEYSALFESTVEDFQGRKGPTQGISKAPLAILQQVPNDLVCKSDGSPQKSLQNTIVHSNSDKGSAAQPLYSLGSEPLDQCDELSLCRSTKEDTNSLNQPLAENEGQSSGIEIQHSDSSTDAKAIVHSSQLSNDSINQPSISVSTEVSDVMNDCTKDSKISSADSSLSSIVKIRKMMFEGETKSTSVDNFNAFRKSNTAPCKLKVEESPNAQMKESLKAVGSTCTDTGEEKLEEHFTVEQADSSESLNIKAVEIQRSEKDSDMSVGLSKDDSSDLLEKRNDLNQVSSVEELQTSGAGDSSEVKFNKDIIEKEKVDGHALSSSVLVKPSVSPRKILLVQKQPQNLAAANEEEDYPTELNPFGDEDDEEEGNQSQIPMKPSMMEDSREESRNTFGSSDEEEPVVLRKKSVPYKPPRPPPPPHTNLQNSSDSSLNQSANVGRPATVATIPATATASPGHRKVIPAPASLNPFWSDGEEPEDESPPIPVPLPRTVRLTPEPSPRPRTTIAAPSKLTSSSGKFGSSSSLSSMASNTGTNRRSKKPAPAPPSLSVQNSSPRSSLPPSPNPSMRSPHKRKSRPAPPPPSSVTGPIKPDEGFSKSSSLDGRKMMKDEANRTMQAEGKEEPALPRDKSTFGQWKRKKGPAPPRPLPQRRHVRAMPAKELKRELDDIEIKQLELERQGVKLEQTIRVKFDQAPSLNESSMTPDVEDLVIQLFELVNEKNELFRKQAELMYLRRQQRLEEEHAELEYQIRCLMDQPERNKTDIMKAREEELIQRLVEVVERRNEIIECLEMDRIREAEEDQSIHSRLGLFAAKNVKESEVSSPSKVKKEKKKKKEKDSKKKKDSKIDADKDIDEVEAAAAVAAAKEKKSKKKWF